MYTLIENNEFLEKNLNELKKHNIKPITLYNISYNNKGQFKEDLSKITNQKTKQQPKHTAILIKLLKIDNSTQGFISTLKSQFNIVIGLGGMNKINRFFVEQTQIDILCNPQNSQYYNKIDFIHHFNSGLNHVLCKVAKQNNINFLFTLNELTNKLQAKKEIARINQNLKFANKYKIKSNINFIIKKTNQIKSTEELNSILSIFDISTTQKKESQTLLQQILENNEKEKSSKYISDKIQFD